VNGPEPHGYNFKLNRKVKDLAKISALVYKARENKIVIVEDLSMETPKTKDFTAILDSLRGDSRKTMLVLPEHNDNVYLSARNLSNNKTVVLSDMNTYDLTNASVVIFTESAAKMFNEATVEEEAA
jgi:large subunit ribosomal protein L4